jgi:hypothetical protein
MDTLAITKKDMVRILLKHATDVSMEKEGVMENHRVANPARREVPSSASALRKQIATDEFRFEKPSILRDLADHRSEWHLKLVPKFQSRTPAGTLRRALFYTFLGPSPERLLAMAEQEALESAAASKTPASNLTTTRRGRL